MKFSYSDNARQIQFSTNKQLRINFDVSQIYSDVDAFLTFTWAEKESTEISSNGDIFGNIKFEDKVKMVGFNKGNGGHEVQVKFYPESVRCLPIVDLTRKDEQIPIEFLFRNPKFGMNVHGNRPFRVKWILQGWSSSETDDDNCFVEEYKQLYGTWNKSYKTKDGISFCIEPITPDIAHIATLT